MARSGMPSVTEHRFRRRRLLALHRRRNNLPFAFDALKHETRDFVDLRFLERLLVGGRWQEARRYVGVFLQRRRDEDGEQHTALRFIARLNALDDMAHGKLSTGFDATFHELERQIEGIPPTMADDPLYIEAVRTISTRVLSPPHWDSLDWQLIRLKASQIVKDLIAPSPKLRGFQRRQIRKKTGQMSASLLARRFLLKERHPPSPRTHQGSSHEPMDFVHFEQLINETLLAGKQDSREHTDSCSEGIPSSSVGSLIDKSYGRSPADAVTKRFSQEECDAESASGARLPQAFGKFDPDAIYVPFGGINPMHVMKKLGDLGETSGAMFTLLGNICGPGPDHNMFVEKLVEVEKVLYGLRMDCINAKAKYYRNVGTGFTTS